MSQVAHGGVSIIESLSRNDFHQKYIRGVCRTRSFSALASFKAENLSPEEKLVARIILASSGIPLNMTESDDALNEIAAAVSARAVSLQ